MGRGRHTEKRGERRAGAASSPSRAGGRASGIKMNNGGKEGRGRARTRRRNGRWDEQGLQTDHRRQAGGAAE